MFIKNILKKYTYEVILILFWLSILILFNIKVPYEIYTTGGLIDVSKKYEVSEVFDSKGSFNYTYVTQIKGNVITYLLSYIIPNWDLKKDEDLKIKNESIDDSATRSDLLMLQSNQNAVKIAYEYAGKYYETTDVNYYVGYIYEQAETNLEVGDQIITFDGITLNNLEELDSYILTKEIGYKVILKVKNGKKTYERYAYVKEYENSKKLYLYIIDIEEYITKPKIKLNVSNRETGSSGGLLLALSIYDSLVQEDIAKGLTISGTGTIDEKGNVGTISAVYYKLKGAVKKKADVFLVPSGENYEEAIKLKEKYNYDIKILEVKTFEDVLEKLKKI